MNDSITISPVAIVKSQFAANTPVEKMRSRLSQLVIKPEFVPGLMGLKPGMDILVLFYFHRIAEDEIKLQLHPRHNPENPLAGVFATRTQFRPSRIGTTVAQVESIEENVVTVSKLDAQDGTPVLDIKPYTTIFDTDTHTQQFEVRQADNLPAVRHAIDLIDTEVIRLLGNRAKYVHQVVNFKQQPEDIPAPERYTQVMQHRRELAQKFGLNPDVIEKMYKLLVDNFIAEELKIMARQQKNSD